MGIHVKTKLQYIMIIFLFIIGLFISGIGRTWCRYQVTNDIDVVYRIKDLGQFYVSDKSDEWFYNEGLGAYQYDFVISNTDINITDENGEVINPSSTYDFKVRWKTELDIPIYLLVTQESGRERLYLGVKNEVNEYVFFDEFEKEIEFTLLGNTLATEKISLVTFKEVSANLSEFILLDGAYDEVGYQDYIVNQPVDMVLSSNYLLENEVINYYLEDQSVDITIKSNLPTYCKLRFNASENLQVSLNEQEEVTLDLNANQEEIITLNWINNTNSTYLRETITVYWDIYDDSDTVIRTLLANFIVEIGQPETDQIQEEQQEDTLTNNITLNYVDDIHSFSKYQPLKISILSELDYVVDVIGSYFPSQTRYSLDEGKSWFILDEQTKFQVNLEAEISRLIIIDFSHTDVEWSNQDYEVAIYTDYNELAKLSFMMFDDEITLFDITHYEMELITENNLIFTLSNNNVDITIEYYKEGVYEEINMDEQFEIENPIELIYVLKIKENVEIPNGSYRIKIKQTFNEQTLREKYLYFYALEEENELVEDVEEEQQAEESV